MPSIDVLSVGGTLSANAHGADFRTGSLASTVRSLRVMTADGTVRTLARDNEPERFRTVIGGYGLFGVILEAELDLVPSEMYRLSQTTVRTEDFPALYDDPGPRRQVPADVRAPVHVALVVPGRGDRLYPRASRQL